MYLKIMSMAIVFASSSFAVDEGSTSVSGAKASASEEVSHPYVCPAVRAIWAATQRRRGQFNADPALVRESYDRNNPTNDTNIIVQHLKGPVSERHASTKEKELIAKSIFAGELVHGPRNDLKYWDDRGLSSSDVKIKNHHKTLQLLRNIARDFDSRLFPQGDAAYLELKRLSGISKDDIFSWFRDTYEKSGEEHTTGLNKLEDGRHAVRHGGQRENASGTSEGHHGDGEKRAERRANASRTPEGHHGDGGHRGGHHGGDHNGVHHGGHPGGDHHHRHHNGVHHGGHPGRHHHGRLNGDGVNREERCANADRSCERRRNGSHHGEHGEK